MVYLPTKGRNVNATNHQIRSPSSMFLSPVFRLPLSDGFIGGEQCWHGEDGHEHRCHFASFVDTKELEVMRMMFHLKEIFTMVSANVAIIPM